MASPDIMDYTQVTTPAIPTETIPVSMKELFKHRDSTEPGSQEEDQAVDRIMEAMFPNSHAR